jgi:hypothetical protein
MTIDEKLAHIESAIEKLRTSQDPVVIKFTEDEFSAIKSSLKIAAGICDALKEKWR